MHGLRPLLILFAAALSAAPAGAQEGGIVSGLVVDTLTDEPLAKAVLTLYPREQVMTQQRRVYSDAQGKFVFADVPPGRYSLTAQRTGYVDGAYGREERSGTGGILDVPERAAIDDVVMRLQAGGVISGRVVDELGLPLARARVEAMEYRYRDGKRELIAAASAETDDRGTYRMWGLAPGRYYIRAYLKDGSYGGAPRLPAGRSYVPIFFPGTENESQSSQVEAVSGVETPGIDIRLEPQTASTVSGVVTDDETGKPISMAMIVAERREGRTWGRGFFQSMIRDAQGRFEIQGLRPGEYTLYAMPATKGRNERRWGRTRIVVANEDIDDVRIVLVRGVDLGGRIVVEDDVSIEDRRIYVALRSVEGGRTAPGASGGLPDSDNRVRFEGVFPGEYSIRVGGEMGDLYLKSVKYDGREAIDSTLTIAEGVEPAEFEILLSPRGGRIAGLAENSDGEPVVGATVVLFAKADPQDERFVSRTATDQNGVYTLRGIRPGEYVLLAWEQVESGAWQDSAFLDPLLKDAETIEVGENDALQLNLEAIQAHGERR